MRKERANAGIRLQGLSKTRKILKIMGAPAAILTNAHTGYVFRPEPLAGLSNSVHNAVYSACELVEQIVMQSCEDIPLGVPT
jgi:hypothetical protein